MILIDRIALNNVVTYKNQTFDFQEGLTLVKGENRAGKSLLFSSLANLLYYSHPLADKKDPKALLSAKSPSDVGIEVEDKKRANESSITVHIRPSTAKHIAYEIKQKSAKDSVGYQIKENGVDIDARTIALAKTAIESIYNQPEDIFFTSTYLTSYRNHPLLHGSTSQRYEFFEKLFNFELFDYIHKHINEELKILASKQVELTNLKSLVLELPNKELALQEAIGQLQILKQKREQLQTTLSIYTQLRLELLRLLDASNDYQKEVNNYTNLTSSNESLLTVYTGLPLCELLPRITQDVSNRELLYNSRVEQEKSRKYFNDLQTDVNSWQLKAHNIQKDFDTQVYTHIEKQTDLQAVKVVQQETEGLIQELKAPFHGKSLAEWQTLHMSIAEQLTLAEAQLESKDVMCSDKNFSSLQETFLAEQTILTHQIQDAQTKLSKFNALSTNQTASGQTLQCPTCFTGVNLAQLENHKQELLNSLNIYKEQLSQCQIRLAIIQNITQLKENQKRLPDLQLLETNQIQLQLHQNSLLEYKSLIGLLTEKLQVTNNLNLAKTRFEEFQKANPLITSDLITNVDPQLLLKEIDVLKDCKRVVEALINKEEKLQTKLQDLNKFIDNQPSLHSMKGKIDLANINDRASKVQRALEEQLVQLTKENADLQTPLTQYSVQEALLGKEIAQLKLYESKIPELEEQCKRIDLFNKLLDVFQPKGFRLEKIKYFTKVFESILNKFAGFLFLEPFQFQVVVEKRDLQIIATRSDKSSDVRYLSGSESRCFQLLCLISILALLPQNKRTNICILDEMDAGCDETTTRMFYESFLPELRNIVPSVVVITPLRDSGFYIKEDRSYLIRKINGESTIQLTTK